jgi:hypothetical protein
MEEQKLRQLFRNRSNCYVDTDDVVQGMDENCFIETVNEALRLHDVSGRSEQLVCDCGSSHMTWYGNDDNKQWFCFNCKKEAN